MARRRGDSKMLSLSLDWFYVCVCIALARPPHGNRGGEALDRARYPGSIVMWHGMGAMALALPLPARTGRQHTVKGSHKKNDVNAVASKCINLEVFCVSVNRRPANDQ